MPEFHFGILIILGIGLFGGLLGGWFFQKLKIPQVVGYIVIGLIVGQLGLKLVSNADMEKLRPFNMFALGIIGFLVGGELKIGVFRQYFKQLSAILLAEGLFATVLVGIPFYFIIYSMFGNVPIALASAMVFGAIASATDPASTMDVLWEYRAKGVLTTTITAIVALDDALAMTLYGIGTSAAELVTSNNGSILGGLGTIGIDLGGAVGIGALGAVILVFLMKWLHQAERVLAFAIGMILLLIGITVRLDLDVILAAMTVGFVLTNLTPKRSEELFKVMRGFSIPIYVLFFVFVGARLQIANMPFWLWGLVIVYVIGRNGGKIIGSYFGAKITNADPVVGKYLGFGIFAQGGVAIGLAIVASQHLTGIMLTDGLALGDAIIFAVTATTLIMQLVGPPLVKLSIKLAKENGRNITKEDIISNLKVKDVIIKDFLSVKEDEPVCSAIHTFVNNEYSVYPVVNNKGAITGILNFDGLKNFLTDQNSWQWLLVSDIMSQIEHTALVSESLKDVYYFMQDGKIEQMPVLENLNSEKPIGIIDFNHTNMQIQKELIQKQAICETK